MTSQHIMHLTVSFTNASIETKKMMFQLCIEMFVSVWETTIVRSLLRYCERVNEEACRSTFSHSTLKTLSIYVLKQCDTIVVTAL